MPRLSSEHRLRRLINQGLGYRNFNQPFSTATASPTRGPDRWPIPSQAERADRGRTIALDAGFASLGPFNRAFQASTPE